MQDPVRPTPRARPDRDRALLAQALHDVAAGDRSALEDVYRRTSVKLFGVCLRILPDRSLAEDVLQEIYLAVWTRAGTFDSRRGSAMTWLITLARNRSVDRLRSGGGNRTAPIELAESVHDDHPDAFAAMAASEEERRMATCMAGLDRTDAGLLNAAFFGGATYSELAERAAAPLGTIKSRIRRALLKLRECLQ
jgi:RNA polymerase sigma factor (sigma-70 family)